MPKVSILTPCFNAQNFILEAVASVLDQSFHDFEIILCDDGSTDRTFEIISKLQGTDPRIKVIKNAQNLGISDTRNRLIEESKGEFITFLDSDDQMYPDRLELQVEFLMANPQIDIIGSNYQEFNSKNLLSSSHVKLQHSEILNAFKYMCPIPNPTLMARKEVLRQIPFSNNLTSAEDLDFLLKAMERGHKFANLPCITTLYRVHENSVTSQGKFQMQLNTYLAFQQHKYRKKNLKDDSDSLAIIRKRSENSLYIKYSSPRNLSILDQLKCLLVAPFSKIGQFFLVRRIFRALLN